MKNKTLITLIIALLLITGGGTAYAVGQAARSNAIGEDVAINFCCVDAGISPEDITRSKVEFDYERGRFIYEIEFIAGDTEYEYKVDANNGEILERESEILFSFEGSPEAAAAPEGSGEPSQEGTALSIDDKEALSRALADAGLTSADVKVKKNQLDREDGHIVYEVEFAVVGEMEYDYSIDAFTGEILEKSTDRWEMDDYFEYGLTPPEKADESASSGTAETATPSEGDSSTGGNSTGGSTAGNGGNGGGSKSDGTTGSGSTGGTAAGGSSTGGSTGGSSAGSNNGGSSASSSALISVEDAKAIAFSHAGVSEASVQVSKAKLERDDGIQKYDIEFYIAGVAEYDYEINAVTGAILEAEKESLAPAVSQTPAPSPAPASEAPAVSSSPQKESAPVVQQPAPQTYRDDDDDDDWDDDDWDDDDDDDD